MHNKNVSPEKLFEINWDFAKTSVLAAGVELGVFTQIAGGKKTVAQIARSAKSSRRGMEMLLNALTGLGLLAKDKVGCFSLKPEAGEFLVRTKPRYLGDMSLHALELNQNWLHLAQCVRSGKPYVALGKRKVAEDYFSRLVRGLFKMNYPCAKYAAAYLKSKQKRISAVLDVAAGSGVWSIAVAEEFKEARITALDFPAVLKVTREYVKSFKLRQRYKYISGDIRRINFGKERYDLVILGHICHSEGQIYTQQLLKKSFCALKKGGVLLIAEFLLDKDKSGPLMPLLFALNMLVNTNEGDVYRTVELKRWLHSCGFSQVKILHKSPAASPLILAVKK